MYNMYEFMLCDVCMRVTHVCVYGMYVGMHVGNVMYVLYVCSECVLCVHVMSVCCVCTLC